jgi:hypothetical protein
MTIRAAALALRADPRTVRAALIEALAAATANRAQAHGAAPGAGSE